MKLTMRWRTVATVCFTHEVSKDENKAAHGGVCLLQLRKGKYSVFGRKINVNGLHKEVGEPFLVDDYTKERWLALAAVDEMVKKVSKGVCN